MTSSYESYSRAGADEPDVGIPNILKRILRYLSLLAPSIADQPYLGRITGKPETIDLKMRGRFRVNDLEISRCECP